MGLNLKQQEAIDLFLQGQLKGEALLNFQKELASNLELKEALDLQQSMAEGIEQYGNQQLRKRFSRISKEVKDEGSNNNSFRRFIRPLLMAAAVITLLLVASTFLFQKSSSEKLYAQFYTPAELSITRNGNTAKQIIQMESFYNQKKYAASIPFFKEVLKTQPLDSKIQLAYGNALLNTELYEEAVGQFQNILNQKDPLYADQAKWFLALTFLKSNAIEKCKPLLKELITNQDSDFHKEAVDLMGRLK